MLFEAGYLSNADDEVLLRDPKHRAEIALALAQAIEADVAARVIVVRNFRRAFEKARRSGE